MDYFEKLKKIVEFIRAEIPWKPDVGLVLGSGLGDMSGEIKDGGSIGYDRIPEFPVSTVPGHEGSFVFGTLSGKKVLAMKGRFHHYEGYDMKTAAMGVMAMGGLGIGKLILTNAAGGINGTFKKGCLMIIRDHMGFFGPSPLRGSEFGEHGPRFPDMSCVYSPELIRIAQDCAKTAEVPVHSGVYCYFRGPQFETPAEIRAMGILGADAVGMSTVPEAIAAKYSGMEVLGISCITNMAAGLGDDALTHEDVIETTKTVRESFMKYIKDILEGMEA